MKMKFGSVMLFSTLAIVTDGKVGGHNHNCDKHHKGDGCKKAAKKATLKKIPRESRHPHPRHVRDLQEQLKVQNNVSGSTTTTVSPLRNEQFDDNLTSIAALYYTGPVTVGSETFQVIYDTGSSMLWVPGPTCDNTCGNQPLYNGVYTNTGQQFNMQYGSGTVNGMLVDAPVSIAGATVSSQLMGLATQVQFSDFGDYSNGQYSGLLGLAWPSLADPYNVPPIVPQLYAAGEISENLFALFLANDGSGGELSIGEADSSHYTGNITWMPLQEQSWWTISLLSVSVGVNAIVTSNPSTVPASTVTSSLAIVDSGTSLITGPDKSITAIINAISSAAGVPISYQSSTQVYQMNCDQVSSLPTITFKLYGSDNKVYDFTMSGNSYVVPQAGSSPSQCGLGFQQSGGSDQTTWIMGDPFLRVFYSVYDYGNSRVGLAVAYPPLGTALPGGTVIPGFAGGFSIHWLSACVALLTIIAGV